MMIVAHAWGEKRVLSTQESFSSFSILLFHCLPFLLCAYNESVMSKRQKIFFKIAKAKKRAFGKDEAREREFENKFRGILVVFFVFHW